MGFAILATVCAGLFAGAAIYISAVEHPARLACGTAVAIRQFAPSYRRATIMQASLAVVGFLAAVAAWWRTDQWTFLVGGFLLGAIVPFTLVVIFPTNQQLLSPDLDHESAEAGALLRRWGQLHAVRSLLGGLAFIVLLVGVAPL